MTDVQIIQGIYILLLVMLSVNSYICIRRANKIIKTIKTIKIIKEIKEIQLQQQMDEEADTEYLKHTGDIVKH